MRCPYGAVGAQKQPDPFPGQEVMLPAASTPRVETHMFAQRSFHRNSMAPFCVSCELHPVRVLFVFCRTREDDGETWMFLRLRSLHLLQNKLPFFRRRAQQVVLTKQCDLPEKLPYCALSLFMATNKLCLASWLPCQLMVITQPGGDLSSVLLSACFNALFAIFRNIRVIRTQ